MTHDVTHNPAADRFEVVEDGQTAVLEYRMAGHTIAFIHTGVPPALEGRGIAGALARTGLEYAREHGLAVRPLCPYVRAYIERHPEYQPLVKGYGGS